MLGLDPGIQGLLDSPVKPGNDEEEILQDCRHILRGFRRIMTSLRLESYTADSSATRRILFSFDRQKTALFGDIPDIEKQALASYGRGYQVAL